MSSLEYKCGELVVALKRRHAQVVAAIRAVEQLAEHQGDRAGVREIVRAVQAEERAAVESRAS